MKGRHNTRWTVLILLALAFIWGNSLMPPRISWAISDAVQRILSWFTPVGSPEGNAGTGIWGVLVRKAAHFTEFLALGVLLALRFDDRRKRPWPALLAAALAALADETIQYFTGRTSSVWDVWLDIGGAAAGVLLSLWCGQKRNTAASAKEAGGGSEDGKGP